MNLPTWLHWLIPILMVLTLLFLIYFMFQTGISKERHRKTLHINLLQEKNKLLEERVAQLEARLEQELQKQVSPKDQDALAGKEVFISYSSKDYEIAKVLQELLAQHFIPSFMAPDSIPAGSNYTQEIPDAIGKCFAMVVLLTQSAQESRWVSNEIDLALEDNVPIIPYLIDLDKPNRQFRFMLGQCQYIHFQNNTNYANTELINRLKALQTAATKQN